MKDLERLLKAVANKRRLAIIYYLKNNKEATVGNIATSIRLSFKATSRHLSILAVADIVEKDQRGLQMFYRLMINQKPVIRYIVSIL